MKVIETNGVTKIEADEGKELYFKSNPDVEGFRIVYLGKNDTIDNYDERDIKDDEFDNQNLEL